MSSANGKVYKHIQVEPTKTLQRRPYEACQRNGKEPTDSCVPFKRIVQGHL